VKDIVDFSACNVLLISDLHLCDKTGADNFGVNQEKKFITLLRNLYPDIIIFVGDTFELWQTDMETIFAAYQNLWQELERYEYKLIFIKGNHDWTIDETTFPYKVCTEFNFIHGGKIYHCEHGHKYDIFKHKWWILAAFFVNLYGYIERLIFRKKSKQELRLFKMQTKTPDNNRYEKAAQKMLRNKNYDVVVMGHTHQFVKRKYSTNQLYLNTGTWVDGKTDFFFLKRKKS